MFGTLCTPMESPCVHTLNSQCTPPLPSLEGEEADGTPPAGHKIHVSVTETLPPTIAGAGSTTLVKPWRPD